MTKRCLIFRILKIRLKYIVNELSTRYRSVINLVSMVFINPKSMICMIRNTVLSLLFITLWIGPNAGSLLAQDAGSPDVESQRPEQQDAPEGQERPSINPNNEQDAGEGQDPGDDLPAQELLPYGSPFDEDRETFEGDEPKGGVTLPTDLMTRISCVYKQHVLAVDAQIQGRLVEAENHIIESFNDIQEMLDDYPEVRNEERFVALYRVVMAEYRAFYAIREPVEETEGEVFAIIDELAVESDEWMVEGFSLPDGLSFARTEVPLVQNRHVSRHLMYYTMRRPEVMEKWLQRSERYFPMMREIFEEEGTPLELIHLSMIESGLVSTARSWASAVGMWQFIRATGSAYGLEVNWWVDERRDPVKATRAAARHLNDLYDIWGDWHLAIANYNISPRGLRRAIRAGGGVEDYWTAFPYLPRETRGYVPGFIAATTIAMNPVEFGFQRNYGGERFRYEVVSVDGLMPLDKLAEAAGIGIEELKRYNPELLRWATPPGGSYPLKLPVEVKETFLAAYDQIPREERASEIAMHIVKGGETLGAIARRYGTSVRSLYETNENLSSLIYPGQRIVVPIAPGSMETLRADRPSNAPGRTSSGSSSSSSRSRAQAPANSSAMSYTVKSGDTIGHIAEWFDVRAWQIRSWNGIGNTIRVGQTLTIYVPQSAGDYFRQIDLLSFAEKQGLEQRQRNGESVYSVRLREPADGGSSGSSGSGRFLEYTVRRNETLSGIARKHGVTVPEIQRANNMSNTRIYAGQSLQIPVR